MEVLVQERGEMPPTEMTEVAGFTGLRGYHPTQFDDGKGTPVPSI